MSGSEYRGYVFGGGSGHCFSGKRMGSSGARSFHTGRSSFGRQQQSPPAQMANHQPPLGNACLAKEPYSNCYQANSQGFINGIKKIVNGFINPNLNCDFHSDHHRYYNPKYRNNFMMERKEAPLWPKPTTRPVVAPPTVFLDLGKVENNIQNVAPESAQRKTNPCQASASFQFTIFTSDDFPALPEVKKQMNMSAPSISKVANTLPRRRRKGCRDAESPVRKQIGAADPDITCEDFVVLPKPKICDSPTPAVNNPTCNSPERPFRRHPRVRQISECSDDSFVICFSDEAREGVLEVALDSDDSDDSDLESNSTGSSDEDDIDETDNHVNIPDFGQLDSGFDEKKDKKVRFNLNPEVHVMYKWDFAYRAARKGHWENFARDRDRFKKRTANVAHVLNPILDTQHREKIYRTRFCDSDNSANNVR